MLRLLVALLTRLRRSLLLSARYAKWTHRLGVSGRSADEEEIAREIAVHLEFHIEDNIRAGMSPAVARRQALIKLGGLHQTIEACQDVRQADRLVRRVKRLFAG